ncbi:MAG: glycosyltransferase family 2 protein [bacterium]|nr:glycosyltransferase family 2 protein [bacterium]
MKIIYLNNNLKNPKVSIILIDWSVRHSFHILEYLNKQTIDREKYEIIWIEYYDRKAKEIEEKLYKSIEKGFPILDKWVILEMPKNVYYHKHIMFNIGIILSQGEIICIPDSDAMVKETFVKTIIKEFEKDPNIVLHIDEIRNENKKFYPFNYPSFEEVLGKGRVLRWDGKTDIDKLKDPIHLLNYGACMCAKKEHLISIGGADEHIDYLGHICGVYEMTFRLKNYGLKEIWSKEEFLYHTWHPGESGSFDYMGPHDGLNMSTTALNTLITKRIYPLEENMGIKYLREKKNIDKETLLKMVLSDKRFGNWTIECLKSKNFEIPFFKKLRVFFIIFTEIITIKQLTKILKIIKETMTLQELKKKKGKFLIVKIGKLILYIYGCIYWQIIFQVKRQCKVRNCFYIFYHHIIPQNIKNIYFIGKDKYTFLIIYLGRKFNVKMEKLTLDRLARIKMQEKEKFKIIISCFKDKEKYYKLLKSAGVLEEDIILL